MKWGRLPWGNDPVFTYNIEDKAGIGRLFLEKPLTKKAFLVYNDKKQPMDRRFSFFGGIFIY